MSDVIDLVNELLNECIQTEFDLRATTNIRDILPGKATNLYIRDLYGEPEITVLVNVEATGTGFRMRDIHGIRPEGDTLECFPEDSLNGILELLQHYAGGDLDLYGEGDKRYKKILVTVWEKGKVLQKLDILPIPPEKIMREN